MGIFGIGHKKKEKEPLGVCIPQHKKKAESKDSRMRSIDDIRMGSANDEEIPAEKTKNKKAECVFRIDGKYEVGDTLMISGRVESGTLKKGMKTEIGKGELRITELRIGSEKIGEIRENQQGTIFVKARGAQNIKYNDLLEFG